MDILKQLTEDFLIDAINLRHHLHQIPELKYEEKKTGTYIARALKSYGYEVQEEVGQTGVVALLDSGKPGKSIAFRADIDALPFQEDTSLSYKSLHAGKMHACGHDGHTATLLLVARVLQKIKSKLTGKIKLIFQPAEEGGGGALAMIKDNVLQNPPVDAIFGYHNWPGLPLNTLATRKGCILTGSGRFEINLIGKRTHLAKPQDAVNPVMIGAEIITKIKLLSSPEVVINLLGFNSGDWKKGTSEAVEIVGCYFIESEFLLNELKEKINKLAEPYGTAVFHEYCSPTVNSEIESKLVLEIGRQEKIKDVRNLSTCEYASDDFSEYLKRVPGCYFLIGAGESAPSLHTASYDFSDEILGPTALLMLMIALNA